MKTNGKKFDTTQHHVNSSNIFLHLLTGCNMKCAHCYINPRVHGNNMLGIKTVKCWLKLLFNPKLKTNLVFLGGETTLHPDLAEMIGWAKRIGFKTVKIDTNGLLANGILEKVTPGDLDNIAFSIDGATAKTHDSIRQRGSFKILIKGIKMAVAAGFNCTAAFTAHRMNKKEISLMPALVSSLGMKALSVHFVGVEGNEANVNRQLTKKEWEEEKRKTIAEARKNKICVIFPKIFLKPEEKLHCAGTDCQNFHIFPNGRVFRCILGSGFPINSLAINRQGIRECSGLTEKPLFGLNIPEGCVMQQISNPLLIEKEKNGKPKWKIGCCMIKEAFLP